jgi:hypothetical protein
MLAEAQEFEHAFTRVSVASEDLRQIRWFYPDFPRE